MFGFVVKKAFFDMWDHFLAVVIINLGFIVLLTIPILLPPVVVNIHVAFAFLVQAIGVLGVFVYAGVASRFAQDMANYANPEIQKFVVYLKETWKPSLVVGLIYLSIVFVLWVGVPVYSSMGNLLGLAAIIFLFWAIILWLFSSQFFLPIICQLDSKIGKALRKSFIIFFDNTIFSILLGIGSLAVIILSGVTALLIPGMAGLLIWHQVGLKMRLLKYDYLEENPEADRKKVPWDALLLDDKERVGKRTLRGMIFPWKE